MAPMDGIFGGCWSLAGSCGNRSIILNAKLVLFALS